MPPDLLTLRQQLRAQFPEAHRANDPLPALVSLAGLPAFPRGALSELSPATPTASLSLLLARLLRQPDPESPEPGIPGPPPTRGTPPSSAPAFLPPTPGRPLALIDATDSFDPASYGPEACARLLWIRCHEPAQSLPCTDLLLRDGNLPLLVLDLQLVPLRDLHSRSFPPTAWYRLRNLAEQSGTALLVC
ncbi:MAG: hypothetical protein HKN82_11755, partial [Akkermansiaceae bacterium]|nr:hypothetical protein [Akkermansiaceae bacterium]